MLLDKLRENLPDIARHASIAPRIGTVTIRHEDYDWFAKVGIDKPPMDEPGHQHGQPRKWVVAINSEAFAKLVAKEKQKHGGSQMDEERKRYGGCGKKGYNEQRVISEHGQWLREHARVQEPGGKITIVADSPEEIRSKGFTNTPQQQNKKWRIQVNGKALRAFLQSKPEDFKPVDGTQLPPAGPEYHFRVPFSSEYVDSPEEMTKALQSPPAKQLVPRPEDFRTVIGDPVNHPAHYNRGGIECIDVIERLELNYNLGNALKYLWRADAKGARKQDLEKAVWYIKREIAKMEATQ